MSFGKIFESTFTGSMVGSGSTVFAVWSYVIASTRPPGVVEINPVILASMIGASVNDVNDALDYLQAEDERSRSKECDGKRLVKVSDFLYSVPTWQKYRDARNDEERRAYNADAARKHRAKVKASNKPSITVIDNKHASAKAEAEAEAEAEERSRALNRRPAASERPELSEIMPTGAANAMLALQARIQAIKPAWRIAMTYEEKQSLMRNAACLASLTDADWTRLGNYLAAKLPEGDPGWQPRSRGKFIETLPDVHDHACRWDAKKRPNRLAQNRAIPARTPEDDAALAEFLKKQ